MDNPFNFKTPFCEWTANTIRALLETERGATIIEKWSLSLAGEFLAYVLNFRCTNLTSPPDKVRAYLANTYPEAVLEAKRYGASLYS